jgi:glycosyltransferase involved in cell wall biosynthesis
MIGSFHTDLAEYARVLSGSRRLGDLMQRYMRWPYRKCAQIFVPSEATRQLLIQAGIEPTKLDIWRRGVATGQFSPAKRSASLREQWGVSGARPAVLYVGRLSKEKSLDLLAPISEGLRRAGMPHRLVIAGDGPMQRELRAVCAGAVFTGTLTPEDVATAMASADLFVFPSRTDTAGNVVLEAQASGLPVLVSGDGGPRENMVAGQSGFICTGLADFVARATQLLRMPEERIRAGAAARQYALTRSWDLALEPLYQAYGAWGSAGSGWRSSGSPTRMSAPSRTLLHSSSPAVANTMIVDP